MKYSALVILLTFTGLLACNGLFYYPDSREFITPEKVELKFERLSFRSGDETLSMWKIPAVPSATLNGNALGKILHFHGNAQNISTHFLFSAWMARFGFDVYVFDYRGYGKSTGSPDREGLVQDGIAAIRNVADRDDKDFFILAQSLGGAAAIPAVTLSERTSKVRALTLDSTFYSYRVLARDKMANFWLTWAFQWPFGFLVSDDWNPSDYVSGLSMPVLVVHGTADQIVPFEMGKKLYDLIPGNKKTFWTLEGAPHTWFLSEQSDWHVKYLLYLCSHSSRPKECASHVEITAERLEREFDEQQKDSEG